MPSEMPLVSIGVFSFNQQNFVEQALNSALSQSYSNIEVLIYDDASTDGTRDVIEEFLNSTHFSSTVSTHFLSTNSGLASNLNRFIFNAKGDWVVLLAADDYLHPNAIENLTSKVQSDIDVIWGNLSVVDVNGKSLNYERPGETWQGRISKEFIDGKVPGNSLITWNCFVPGGMTLIRKSTILESGTWDVEIKTEDYMMWLKLRHNSKFKFINTVTGYYRITPNSSSRSHTKNTLDQALMVKKLVDQKYLNRSEASRILVLRWVYAILSSRGKDYPKLRQITRVSNLKSPSLLINLVPAVLVPVMATLEAKFRKR